jgi:two-component system cell cycle response regulator CtrA
MRVLLVEDDAAMAASIALMLKKEGFICDTTDLGEDGLEIGKLYDYDMIILDLMLPDIDGYEVLRRLRAARVRTPILILSGLGELDHKLKGLGFGADDFLNQRSAPASWWSISTTTSSRSTITRCTSPPRNTASSSC